MMKKLILLLARPVFLGATCILLLDTSSFAQEIEWQNTIGGNVQDELYSIQQTSDSAYILAGYSNSNISSDKMEDCIGGVDYWIVKTDFSGNIQWQNTIGGNNIDFLYSIQQTSDSGYILGGYSFSNISGDKTENNWNNSYDYWIVKTDASGNIQWQNTIGGNNDDQLYSLQQTLDGGYMLGGWSESYISGDKTENYIGGSDYWVVKTDVSGNIQWQNTIGGSDDDYLRSIQQTSDGGYILGGYSFSNISGDKTENSNGSFDYWIVKIDSIGNIQWQNTIGGNDNDWFYSIQQTSDGGYIFGGYSNSNISGDKAENSNGFVDYWVVKINSSGNIQWQNTIGGNGNDWLYSIKEAADGGYILGGSSNSGISGDKTENSNGGADYWIVKIDSSGNIQWQNTIGGNENDMLYFIQQTNDGQNILGGYSLSNISGDKMENCIGFTDYWIIKLSDKFNLTTGKSFLDINSNSVQDAGEPSAINKQVTEINTGRFTFSVQNGNYSISILDSGNFSVYPAQINYYNAVPAIHNIYFSGINQIDSLNDFAFQPAGVFNDLCVSITPLGAFRAGFNASYMINYENVGTTTISPTVIFFPDNDVTFVSANPVANSVTVDSVVWNFGPLAPFQAGSILVTVNVNVGTPIGALINSGVRIEPVAGDANTACNYSYWEVLTTGSVDPNEILVDEDTVFTTQLSNPPYLEYIIYFQNTGNDTAFNVKILNPIDTFMLQLNTLEFVASSHPVNMSWIPWERNMEFTFDNILLPDSNVNEPASHGFVRYRIKPKTTLVAGDEIQNTAYIYFDFNAPVQTNVAVTEVVQFTNISQWSIVSGQLNVFPNPTSGKITLLFEDSLRGLRLFDLSGREVLFKPIQTTSNHQTSIDVSELEQGIYLIVLNSDEKIYRTKFVKE
ncbi:MAG: T9SS type A sorting domain-containing protein [Bacteroidia bacterium]